VTAAPDVDWAVVEQRARRTDLLTLPVIGVWFASVAELTGRVVVAGAARWWALAGVLVLFGLLLLLQRRVPRLRRDAELGHRVQYALRHGVDPGPGAREKADVGARRLARTRWVVWASPLPALAVLAGGRWSEPAIAVPAGLVFLTVSAAVVLQVDRQVRQAQRWVADPPGPARDVPAPTAVDRWTGGRRVALASLGLGLVGGLLGVLIRLVG
jgi:hypothetical protein